MLCADWDGMVSRPTHERIAERTGLSTRTVRRVRAFLEGAGLLAVLTPGCTRDLLDPDAGALAQAVILTIPARLLAELLPRRAPVEPDPDVDLAARARARRAPDQRRYPWTELSTPLGFQVLEEEPLHARDTRTSREGARCARGAAHPAGTTQELGREPGWSLAVRPVTRAERLAAAAEARRIDPVLRRVSTAHVAALARECHVAGWTMADVRHALQARPDGSAWPHSMVAADVRHVPGWVRHRMSAWRTDPADPASPMAPAPSQQAADAHAEAAAAHAVAVAEDAATRAAAVAPAAVAGWAAARAEAAARLAASRAARLAAARAAEDAARAEATARRLAAVDRPAPAVRPAAVVVPVTPLRPAADSATAHLAALRSALRSRPRPRA